MDAFPRYFPTLHAPFHPLLHSHALLKTGFLFALKIGQQHHWTVWVCIEFIYKCVYCIQYIFHKNEVLTKFYSQIMMKTEQTGMASLHTLTGAKLPKIIGMIATGAVKRPLLWLKYN